ncbi:enoyl-CoA delta isomerase 1, mitochondrial-like [Neocloeon triangulifer]|uniref:enoyl-CoA delta isomerase 1, mitochondrial-like n=1 Tax=Neocloeon triangulifer TaxID=2078957 RepID=UPI00286ED58C|nr:enoyl-CoA delta isomerase 1, mitochondrial-like [Neocloeon triangulifer]XP_059476412.1 enoyl-CoA delta isomerase 1, mitochondrial-like [Neocloeon triangulifer]
MMNLSSRIRPSLLKAVAPACARAMSADAKLVDLSINEKTGIATLTMNRPPVNSLNLELLQGLSKALQELEDNRKCRGMILTSSSPTVFSAGLDIMEMYKPKPDRVKAFWSTLQEVWLQLFGSSYPTVAAINGHSPAGGCLLSLSCEYRVMVGPQYTIGLNETKLGIVAPKWFMSSMLAAIPYRQTELALTTGRMFSTEEALKIGLIDEVATDKADAIAKAEKFLGLFAKIHPVARKLTKLNLRNDALDWLQQNRELDLNIFLSFVNQPIVQSSLEKYLEALKNKQGK